MRFLCRPPTSLAGSTIIDFIIQSKRNTGPRDTRDNGVRANLALPHGSCGHSFYLRGPVKATPNLKWAMKGPSNPALKAG
ncbi:hypothetical protein E2C01_073773 [Portunus trituberculatus]|uniref:Uncharacterized protein n=1 Tax=Portunus trituberculatus TaxID=210409 RepID=A0A5B7ICK0_PORTR|nr:hypothetical protein [Portunus trituberculatus]